MTTTKILKPTKNPTFRTGVVVTVEMKSGLTHFGPIVRWTKTELVVTTLVGKRTVDLKIDTARVLFVSTQV